MLFKVIREKRELVLRNATPSIGDADQ